ncbi:recombinase family protein [Cryobacterium ruanii]|uniref:Recombinase family protein n=1 Tax=Cryobacterium ruanii TaxID=1259197 RepID=A0A4R9AKS7_9MICO|nr:recombinase family protein [Cryobacterium ruanii]
MNTHFRRAVLSPSRFSILRLGHRRPAGLTGANRARPGRREAPAACRDGETPVVTKIDRLARSLLGARDIVDELTRREAKRSIGGSVHGPTDPVGRPLFNVLAMVAEFEADLIRARTRDGMAVAKAKGRLREKKPKLCKAQETHLVSVHLAGTHMTVELAELCAVAHSTVYRAIKRAGDTTVSNRAIPPSKPESAPAPLKVNFCTELVLNLSGLGKALAPTIGHAADALLI